MNKCSAKGFSLIELLIVVAIVSVLSGIGYLGYNSYINSSKEKITETNHARLTSFIKQSMMQCEAKMELILNDENGKTDDQCGKYNEANLANLKYAFVKHFQNGDRWCSPFGKVINGICESAIIDAGYYNENSIPSNKGVSGILYGLNVAGKDCWSIIIKTRVSNNKVLESVNCRY